MDDARDTGKWIGDCKTPRSQGLLSPQTTVEHPIKMTDDKYPIPNIVRYAMWDGGYAMCDMGCAMGADVGTFTSSIPVEDGISAGLPPETSNDRLFGCNSYATCGEVLVNRATDAKKS
jgi:hypothetical protein